METSEIIILSFLGALIIYLLIRGLNTWYWKINERIALQLKTNFLLEKILIQLGATNADTLTVEEIKTGEKKTINLNEWIAWKMANPKDNRHKTIK